MDWSLDGLKAAILNETTYLSNKIDNELTYAEDVMKNFFSPDASNNGQSGQDESDDTISAASTQSANRVPAPSGEEWYYQKAQEIQNKHPDWTTDQITNKMSEEIWNNNYNALMDDIAHSKTPEERDQKIRNYQAELDNYKASGINVDNDVEYLRDVQGMPGETISSKIVSLMSNYSFNGVEYQYSVAPDSFAFVEIPKDGISIEKYTDYQIQKNDDENTVHNSFQQQVEELLEKAKNLQFINGRQLTDADREAGYQLMPTLNGLTYVRAIYEDGNWVIHPDDRQLDQESNQDVAKSTLIGGVLPGVLKGVGVGGKSLYKAISQELSTPAINNPLPQNGMFARVMPEKFAKLLQEGEAKLSPNGDAWVTAADDLKDIVSSEEAAKKLTLVDAEGKLRLGGNAVVEFRLKSPNGIATPVNRIDPGFIGGGRTAGGAREFIIPSDAEIEIVNIRILEWGE